MHVSGVIMLIVCLLYIHVVVLIDSVVQEIDFVVGRYIFLRRIFRYLYIFLSTPPHLPLSCTIAP